VRFSFLFTPAEAALLAVSGIRLKASITVSMATVHHDGIDHEFEADRALEELGVEDLCDLAA
jgi:hypothetical protein